MDEADALQAKLAWSAPTLTVFGSVEQLTLACDKMYGSSDSFTFMGMDIVCSS